MALSFSQEEFDLDNIRYSITSTDPNTVELIGPTDSFTQTDLVIPDIVTNNGIDYSVTTIGSSAFYENELKNVSIPNSVTTIGAGAFGDNQLTSVSIPNNVTTIGSGAFEYNQLESVSIGNNVTTIGDSAFGDSQLKNVSIPNSVITIGGFAFSGNQLESVTIGNSLTTIGSGAFFGNQLKNVSIPNNVTTIGSGAFNNNQLENVSIPNSVTTIGNSAFQKNQLGKVTIGNSVTTIGSFAFLNNQLESVSIPNSVTTIGKEAFFDNPLTEIISEGTAPATIEENSFGDRENINLIVPIGLTDTYKEKGWTGFNITEANHLKIKVYLQGAYTINEEGEESLMRDDLRAAGALPTSSPYQNGETIDNAVFNATGSNAIVDWVEVELREATDNTSVVDSRSALLQRDGDVVALDGISGLAILEANIGNYYIVVNHRNHLGIMTANTVSLSSAVITLDLTRDPSLILGGEDGNAVKELEVGVYGLIGGDFDGNGQIQPPDLNGIVPLIGRSGYNQADVDMNNQILSDDITSIVNPNIGKGEQFTSNTNEGR